MHSGEMQCRWAYSRGRRCKGKTPQIEEQCVIPGVRQKASCLLLPQTLHSSLEIVESLHTTSYSGVCGPALQVDSQLCADGSAVRGLNSTRAIINEGRQLLTQESGVWWWSGLWASIEENLPAGNIEVLPPNRGLRPGLLR